MFRENRYFFLRENSLIDELYFGDNEVDHHYDLIEL